MQCRFTLRIVLLFVLIFPFTGISGSAAGVLPSTEGKKYHITFGESYHNYLPGSIIRIRVIFKNNSSENLKVSQNLIVVDSIGVNVWKTMINLEILPNGNVSIPLLVPAPKFSGIFKLTSANSQEGRKESNHTFGFTVIQPMKSSRLSKILVHSPDCEEGLNKFLKTWDLSAPTITWGQVLLCGKKSLVRFINGDHEITQLVDRALKREMSVIFLDFGQYNTDKSNFMKVLLPFDVLVSFIKTGAPRQSFVLLPDNKELTFGFRTNIMNIWNGLHGVNVPATGLKFEGKGVKINAFATAGNNPYRYPVIELIPENDKGKIYLSQIITDGRLDESIKPSRNHPEFPAYDPMAVQFLLNLISATVGDNLLK